MRNNKWLKLFFLISVVLHHRFEAKVNIIFSCYVCLSASQALATGLTLYSSVQVEK